MVADDDLPRLETLAEVLNDLKKHRLQAATLSRKRAFPIAFPPSARTLGRLSLKDLLQNLFQDAPKVLQGPLERTIALIDDRREPRNTWHPTYEELEIEADLKAVEGLLDLVKDMARSASADQKDFLDNLKADLELQEHRLHGRI